MLVAKIVIIIISLSMENGPKTHKNDAGTWMPHSRMLDEGHEQY